MKSVSSLICNRPLVICVRVTEGAGHHLGGAGLCTSYHHKHYSFIINLHYPAETEAYEDQIQDSHSLSFRVIMTVL